VNSFRESDGDQQDEVPMSVARTRIGIASSSKEILVCGGWDGSTALSSCELYRSTENRWITLPSLDVARHLLRIVWLPDGRAFAIGGGDGKQMCYNNVEMMTCGWNTDWVGDSVWRKVAEMLNARSVFAAIVLHDLVFVAGGKTTGGVVISSVELFTPPAVDDQLALGQWTDIQPMLSPMYCFSGVVFGEAVLILDLNSSKMQRYRPSRSNAQMQWTTTVGFAGWV